MTSRQDRSNDAINPLSFQSHELSFAQLIVWAQQFAQELPFRDQHDVAQGNWGNLFQQNEIVVSAAVLTFDIRKIQEQFKQAQLKGESVTAEYLFSLLNQLQAWYQYLPSSPETAYQFKYYLLDLYQRHLTLPLSLVISRLPTEFRNKIKTLDTLWRLDAQTLDTASKALQQGSFIEQMRHCFAKMMYVIEHIKQESENVLKQALRHQENSPQLALYFTFLKLFERAQQQLNLFTERHLQFYYEDVLQQKKQIARTDSVFLKLSLNKKNKDTIQFEKDAEFSPGDDPTFTPIIYRTSYPIEVNDAEVTHIVNLTLQRDPLVSPERESGLVCGVSGQQITIQPDVNGSHFPPSQQFDLFGHEHSSQDETQLLGLMITDPTLTMQQGERCIEIEVKLKEVRSSIIEQELMSTHTDSETKIALHGAFSQLVATHSHLFEEWTTLITADALVKYILPEHLTKLRQLEQQKRCRFVYKLFYIQLLQFINAPETLSKPDWLSQPELLFRVIGQIVSRYALYNGAWLTDVDIEQIFTISAPILDKEPTAHTTIKELLSYSSTNAFYQLFQDIFTLECSTETGWENITNIEIHPLHSRTESIGFHIKCHIGSGFAPIIPIHNNLLYSASLKITLKPQSNCFPYAIFRDFELSTLSIDTQVSGLSQVQLFNQEGQADSSQPFFLFGAQPQMDAYAIIASEEIARKPLQNLALHFEWGNLPRGLEGFVQHYSAYPLSYNNTSFQITTEVLNDGQWMEVGTHPQSLFMPPIGALNRDRHLNVTNIDSSYTPVTRAWPKIPYSNQSAIRNGLFKITLSNPEQAFGHTDYPSILSDVLTHNVKSKHKKSKPNAPYTPLVNRLTLDYSARSVIEMMNIGHESQSEIVHLHPFGNSVIYPQKQTRQLSRPRLLANYQEDSHCFIGITASELSGYLNLYFVFDGSSKLLMPYPSTSYHWYYLVDDEWFSLNPNQIIHDTTQNFLTSGIITLEIPNAINTQHNIMPNNVFWLRVSTNKGVGRYPHCMHVATHVIEVVGKGAPLADDGIHALEFSDWRSKPRRPNLAAIAQLSALRKSPDTETDQAFYLRVSEHLRHKGKALTPWDYEHLILEHFPEVGAVYCFPTRTFDSLDKIPGRVLIIVTPTDTQCSHDTCLPKQLDSSYLLNIRRFLLAISRSHVQIEVRNPGYEKIQVRCKITLKQGLNHGPALRRLEYAIKSQLCPWEPDTLNTGLGFHLSLEKLGAYIRSQNSVINVSGLSALKISQDQEVDYTLQDSAVNNQPIKATYPWYVLIPEQHHYIQIADDNQNHAPETAGIGELVIGEQFIIGTTTTSNSKGTEE